MHTHTSKQQNVTKKHSRYGSRAAGKVNRAELTKEARGRNLAIVQLKRALPVDADRCEQTACWAVYGARRYVLI